VPECVCELEYVPSLQRAVTPAGGADIGEVVVAAAVVACAVVLVVDAAVVPCAAVVVGAGAVVAVGAAVVAGADGVSQTETPP
jgi:hypothetical protein